MSKIRNFKEAKASQSSSLSSNDWVGMTASGKPAVDQCSIFTAMLDKIPYYIYVSDPKTYEVLYISYAFRSILKSDLECRKCYEIFQGKSEPCDFCTNDLILKTRQPHVWDYYNRHIGRHFLITDQIIKWPDGCDVRFESAVDITDQKKLEAMLTSSEEKYRTFIEHSSYGFFIMNKNYEITYLNQKAEEIYGSKLKIESKTHMSDIIAPEEQAVALRNLKIVSEGGHFDKPSVYTIKRADGQVRKAEIQTFPLWKDNAIGGFHGTVVDITERLEHERKLKENSEFLDAVIKNSSEGIFVVDDELNYVLINPASGKILGHDPAKWIGKRAGNNKHPDDEKKSIDSIMKVMSEGSSDLEIRVKSSEGKYHLLYIRYTLMNLNNKEHILGIVTDITERRKAEEALKESEEKYRNLFEFSPESIILLDSKGNVMECNKATQALFGRPHDEIIGKHLTDICLMDEPEREYYLGVIESIVNGSRVEKFECEVRKADDKIIWVETFPTLVIQGGTFNAIQMVSRDITERKFKEEEVKKKFLRFNLEAGNTYLARETHASTSLTAFKDIVTFGFPGLVISRHRRRELSDKLDMGYTHILLSDAELPDTIKASPNDLIALFKTLSRRQVVLVDCLDYLVSRIGEKKVLNLIQDINDIAWKKNLIVILSFDPKSVSDTTMNLVKKELREMVPSDSLPKLSPKHLEVLEFVGNSNTKNFFPTYSDIGEALELSKPTVRTRIRELEEMALVAEKAHGRTKRLEITEKGNNYMA